MKIGILTFHSQLNYGGVLQCWALQTALEKLGHDVVVIDRWLDADNSLLSRGYDKWGWWQWIKFWIRSSLGLGNFNQWLRIKRTKKFLAEYLHRTPYHFVDWKDAPQNLGVDAIVVGSDQVWHCGDWGDPRAYLLEGAPSIPAVAYAASLGMTEIPHFIFEAKKEIEAKPLYERGLVRFKAVSCREAEGVRLCEALGVHAEHVVDPTLLPRREDWKPIVGRIGRWRRRKPCLVCYFLSEKIEEAMPALEAFAKLTKCTVKVFVDHGHAGLLPFPSNCAKFKVWAHGIWKRLFGRVSVCVSAGPKEFVRAFADATWVVSDSFHALMFATIFEKNVRILKPRIEFRRKMFARIEEFAEHAEGPLVAEGLDEALASLRRGEDVTVGRQWLERRRKVSWEFLRRELRSEGVESDEWGSVE